MRLGKFMENAQAVLKAIAAPGETGERITAIGRQIGYFGYLSLDNIAWVRTLLRRAYQNADAEGAIPARRIPSSSTTSCRPRPKS